MIAKPSLVLLRLNPRNSIGIIIQDPCVAIELALWPWKVRCQKCLARRCCLSCLSWEGISAARGAWQPDQSPGQRGSLTGLPVPNLCLPSCIIGKGILSCIPREPGHIPITKEELSGGPLGQVSAHSHSGHQVPVPGRGGWRRKALGHPHRCCPSPAWEFQATSPPTKVKSVRFSFFENEFL